MSFLFRLATVAAVALAVLTLRLGSASAHTELAGSEPREGQTFTTPPRQITLSFIESVQPVSAQVSVRGADGRSVTTGPATVAEAVVRQPVAISDGGFYLVAYRVIARDGHPVAGEITFDFARTGSSVAPSPAAAGSPGAASPTNVSGTPVAEGSTAQPAGPGGAVGAGLWWMLGVSVALVGGLGVLAVRRRGPGA
jgi:methionine-rich copper-binding protein CopC